MNIKTDESGCPYFDFLPEDARPCNSIWAFITINPNAWNYYDVNIGMKYLIFAASLNRYYLQEITKYTTDKQLLRYINSEQIFLLS